MAKFVKVPGFERLVSRQPEFLAAFGQIGEAGEELARSVAPTGDDEPHYRDLIRAEVGLSERGYGMARINAWKFTSGFIEFGTIDTPTFSVLRRAGERIGTGKFVPGRGGG